MQLLTSLMLTVMTQVGLDAGTGACRVIWRIVPGQPSVTVVYCYELDWAAGEHTVIWRPEPDEPPGEGVQLRIEPAQHAAIEQVEKSGPSARWVVNAARPGRYNVYLEAPSGSLKWSIVALGQLGPNRILCQPVISIENTGDRALTADGLQIARTDNPGEILSAVQVPPKGRFELPVSDGWAWEGVQVHRFIPATGEIRRVLKLDAQAVASALAEWGVKEILVKTGEVGAPDVRVTLSAERGAEADLGSSQYASVRRVLLEERRDNLDFDRYGRVQGYDVIESYWVEAVNGSGEQVTVEICEDMTSAWEMVAEPRPEAIYTDMAVFRMQLNPFERATISYRIVKHSGSRIK
ncbi:MAG: hypothetical protein H5T86_04325 [Armatimonadetes bacterium]|nr:hypothetical protein [Armatimonadota bacterium]